jgi:O-acetyl-ADP-ribose deacetylase (regulator of RNase III)
MSRIVLQVGDITAQRVDAIVNAANTGLVGGGGVDGAIHRAGGPAIMAECDRIRIERGGCPTGTAVATTAGRLAARFVIHTAGPRWRGGGARESELLASCYRSCLDLAASLECRTVAFPSISTGVYGYPLREAAQVAVATIGEVLAARGADFDEVRMVLFSAGDHAVYEQAHARLSTGR